MDPIVYLLIVSFGIASWIGVNGIWVELPVMVNDLPEGWGLPSYLTIVVSLGNILPLLLIFQQKKQAATSRNDSITTTATKNTGHLPHEFLIVFSVLFMQLLACIFLIFFWNKTASGHSVALLLLVFFISMADCSSSIFFVPYLAHFPPLYLTAYYTGGGLSGLIPGLISLGQGVGAEPVCVNVTSTDPLQPFTLQPLYGQPRFPPTFFFLALALMTGLALVSFLILHTYYLPKTKTEPSRVENTELSVLPNPAIHGTPANEFGHDESGTDEEADRPLSPANSSAKPEVPEVVQSVEGHKEQSSCFLLFLNVYLNFLSNGILPSIQSYSCIPYGNKYYHLAASLSSAANTVACLGLLHWRSNEYKQWLERNRGLGSLAFLLLLMSVYIIVAASQSPDPFLGGTHAGGIMMVVVWILASGLATCLKVMIATILRSRRGYDALLRFGLTTQLGSTCGSLLMFPLVNVYNLFETKMFAC